MLIIISIIFFIIIWLLGNHWMREEAIKDIAKQTGMTEKEAKEWSNELRNELRKWRD